MMRSLGARLFLAAILSVTIALVLSWIALNRLFSDYVADEMSRELQAISDTLVASLNVKEGKLYLTDTPMDARFQIAAGGRYWQIEGPSSIMLRSPSLWDVKIEAGEALKSGSALKLATGPAGDPLIVLLQTVTLEQSGIEYTAIVQVAADHKEYLTAVAGFRTRIFSMLLLTGLFLLSASGLQIFVGLRPLHKVHRAVNTLRQGRMQQISLQGPKEVEPLISEINTLMVENQSAIERARARASDLAHGLKTPLTILAQISESLFTKGETNLANMMDQQVSLIRSRVDRQLALARSGNPSRTSIDVKTALDRLIKATKPLWQNKNITLVPNIPDSLAISVDPTDLLEATGNILDNAIRHARGKIIIFATRTEAAICITIQDDGPGIAPAMRQAALERGRRLDGDLESTGLGMSITHDILTSYGGSISLSNSDMGGLSVQMNWPTRAGI